MKMKTPEKEITRQTAKGIRNNSLRYTFVDSGDHAESDLFLPDGTLRQEWARRYPHAGWEKTRGVPAR